MESRTAATSVSRISWFQALAGSALIGMAGGVGAAFVFIIWAMSIREPGFRRWEGHDIPATFLLVVTSAIGGWLFGMVIGGIAAAGGEMLRRRLSLGLAGGAIIAFGAALISWAHHVLTEVVSGPPGAVSVDMLGTGVMAIGLGGAAITVGFAGVAVGMTKPRSVDGA
jgi:hypothetical protein